MSRKHVIAAIVGLFATVSVAPIKAATAFTAVDSDYTDDPEAPLQDGFLARAEPRVSRRLPKLAGVATLLAAIGYAGGQHIMPSGAHTQQQLTVMGGQDFSKKFDKEAAAAKLPDFKASPEYEVIPKAKAWTGSFEATVDGEPTEVYALLSCLDAVETDADGKELPCGHNVEITPDGKGVAISPFLKEYNELLFLAKEPEFDDHGDLKWTSLRPFSGTDMSMVGSVGAVGDCAWVFGKTDGSAESKCNPLDMKAKFQNECTGGGFAHSGGVCSRIEVHDDSNADYDAETKKEELSSFKGGDHCAKTPEQDVLMSISQVADGAKLTEKANAGNADVVQSGTVDAFVPADYFPFATIMKDKTGVFRGEERSTDAGCTKDNKVVLKGLEFTTPKAN